MKRTVGVVLALLGVAAMSSVALAQAECEKACKKACGAKVVSACAGKTDCGAAVQKLALPSLTYRVGDFQTACATTARNVAARNGEPVMYFVDGRRFEDHGAAVAALTAAVEKQTADMLQVRFVVGKECLSCPNAAASLASSRGTKVLYRVAGHDFQCDKEAARIAERARKAAEVVSMQYKVGKQCLSCPNAAGTPAKSKGQKVRYVIGKKSTACSIEAKLLMAQAKAQAIYAAGEKPAAGAGKS